MGDLETVYSLILRFMHAQTILQPLLLSIFYNEGIQNFCCKKNTIDIVIILLNTGLEGCLELLINKYYIYPEWPTLLGTS